MSRFRRIVILTGAGISAEAGTFDDKDGTWSQVRLPLSGAAQDLVCLRETRHRMNRICKELVDANPFPTSAATAIRVPPSLRKHTPTSA